MTVHCPLPTEFIDRARRLVRDRHGVLTRDLLRAPGGFGLGQVPQRLQPDATTTMVCGFCSIGCGLDVHLKHGEAVNLSPTTQYPVNLGMACPKGWEALTPLRAADRATSPMLRDAGGRLRPVDWPIALDTFVSRMKGIQATHGKKSVAFISTGQIPMEEMALLGALGKFGMGLLHGDGNTRQCMATSVVAYKQAFGFDAPPYTYKDLEESDVIVFIGANPCIAHPILWERVCKNPHRPEIVVIDPRRTETAQAATRHLPLRPKSDLVLLYAVAHVLARQGWIDRPFIDAHTNGFEAFFEHLKAFAPDAVAERCGLSVADIEVLARTIHDGKRVSFLVDDGREPEPRGGAHRAGDHQPGADDRQHRQARAPAPTPSPASATPWARGCSATPPTCWAATISPTRSTAPRWRAFWASTRRASPASRAGPTTRSWRAS